MLLGLGAKGERGQGGAVGVREGEEAKGTNAKCPLRTGAQQPGAPDKAGVKLRPRQGKFPSRRVTSGAQGAVRQPQISPKSGFKCGDHSGHRLCASGRREGHSSISGRAAWGRV